MIVKTRNLTEINFDKINELIVLFEEMKMDGGKYSLTIKHNYLNPNLSWPDMEKVQLHALQTYLEIVRRHIADQKLPIELTVVISE